MKKIIPPVIICGFGAGVLNIVPYLKSFSCCLLIPLSAIIALILYNKSLNLNGNIAASKAVFIGFLTGVFAALFNTMFDILIIFITHSSELAESLPELEKMFDSFPASPVMNEAMDLLYKISDEMTQSGFSLLYTIYFLFTGLFINSIFGIIGGLIGIQIIKRKYGKNNPL